MASVARIPPRSHFPYADLRIAPSYPARPPLENLFQFVTPGGDEYKSEKYAFEIEAILREFSVALKTRPFAPEAARFIHAAIQATALGSSAESSVRADYGIEAARGRFKSQSVSGHEQFLSELRRYFDGFLMIDTAHFEITEIEEQKPLPLTVRATIRYELAGTKTGGGREQRTGNWRTEWLNSEPNAWQLTTLNITEESIARARSPFFVDVTSRAFAQTESYKTQLAHGTDYWRTVLDGACGIDVYGNNGVAIGDFDNDGWDDFYVCQPSGLPNRLYRNCGDGSFEDVTRSAGVDVLDATSCAIFADFENKGWQDLLVVCEGGPLLFLNQGNGKFELKRDAFKFANPPQGTFTHAAVADYDHDGRLDIYFCLYNYYLGLDQYHYPTPYFDARNGPPNFLFHNDGDATFQDRTEAANLNAENDRYSFACAWGDYDSNGWPDLYVANDFGRSNLYRNNGDGTFTAVSSNGVDNAGAGMSACWLDFDGDGNQDIYVGNMWSAAGMRIADQKLFHPEDSEAVRGFYRHHARGNCLYKNNGNARFENVAESSGVDIGRWAWSSDSWDFDHDGYPDLYIANGYVSGRNSPDLASFFWRQLVAKSPNDSSPQPSYEHAWNAVNELVRSDGTWNGYERNVAYVNNGGGTFSDVSSIIELDFSDDSRSFALMDLDHDGRLEIILKNRSAPQLRILRNNSKEIGNSISFRLRGTTSNRDAIGTAITIEAGSRRQTKFLQAGSGFLSQHSKEVFFGVGKSTEQVRAIVRWPSGTVQKFDGLPLNHRIEIIEASNKVLAIPYGSSQWTDPGSTRTSVKEQLPSDCETWLVEPLSAPDFSLQDAAGKNWQLQSLRGNRVLLHFCSAKSPSLSDQLRALEKDRSKFAATATALRVLLVNTDAAMADRFPLDLHFPVLTATDQVLGTYNIVYRYLFDRHLNLPIPTSFLIDELGQIVKIYQGQVEPDHLVDDLKSIPKTAVDRLKKALPFPGKLYQGAFQRNDFTYGVAFFQRGYVDQAAESFRQVIANKPNDAEAYYNLGTLYLRRNDREQASQYLQQAVKLREDYPEAWNNLGMIAAQEGDAAAAVQNFQRSLSQRPDYVTALVNLGNLYRREKSFDAAKKLFEKALAVEPNDPEVNYSIGMLSAQENNPAAAEQYFQKAISLRPDYADALNNLGVLLVREQHYSDAEERFKTCMQVAPNYDQAYLNLARLYVLLNRKDNAREVLQALLRQQPQHKMAQQALEMLH
ncbi:MAG TPA: FG-GAP-like repeat-containing protein [Terriglobales bacterium]|nr:FG-GAP-like repeat-containing protein [Terriglobales bacterium]